MLYFVTSVLYFQPLTAVNRQFSPTVTPSPFSPPTGARQLISAPRATGCRVTSWQPGSRVRLTANGEPRLMQWPLAPVCNEWFIWFVTRYWFNGQICSVLGSPSLYAPMLISNEWNPNPSLNPSPNHSSNPNPNYCRVLQAKLMTAFISRNKNVICRVFGKSHEINKTKCPS